MGTAIVKAGIVDPIMIVTATLTALGLFTTPSFELTAAWRWLFWALIGGAYVFGIFGIVLVTIGILSHLCGMEPFGVPYFSPFGPIHPRDLQDSLIRAPLPSMRKRPFFPRSRDPGKQGPALQWSPIDLDQGQPDSRQ
jgi:hypothetical protein